MSTTRISKFIGAIVISLGLALGISPAAMASHGVPGLKLPSFKVIDNGEHLEVTPHGSVMVSFRYGDFSTGNVKNLTVRPGHKPYKVSTRGLTVIKYYYFTIGVNGKMINLTKVASFTIHK